MKKIFYYERLNDDADAADVSDSPVQSDEYNQGYREWRRCESNPFSFTGKRSSKCHTYIDGIGIHEEKAEDQEKTALRNVCFLIAGAAFLYALAENIFVIPIILILKTFGVEISYSFHENLAYGNQYALLLIFIFEGLMKFFVSIVVIRRILRMPLSIAYPVKIKNKWTVFAAVSTIMIAAAVIMLIRTYIPTNIFTVNSINMTYKIALCMDTGCMIAFLIFEMLIVPVLMELLFHGALFQSMRQFGVTFAVIMLAVINTSIRHNPFALGIVFITSVIAGYGVWQSGSVLTGIIVHILGRGLSLLMYLFNDRADIISCISTERLYILCVLLVGILGWTLLLFSKNKVLNMKDYGTFLTMKEKFKFSIFETSLITVWILYAILVCIEIFV